MNIRITSISWGSIEVEIEGEARIFRDCKIWPGGAVEWDWNETGTHHDPGIQPADVREVLEHGIDVLILTRGQQLRLKTAPETIRLLEGAGLKYHIEETRAAVEFFNRLAEEGHRVGGLFHTTC